MRLLARHDGHMNYMQLIRLLYLADREAIHRWGCPISTDRYVPMENGPVLSFCESLAASPAGLAANPAGVRAGVGGA